MYISDDFTVGLQLNLINCNTMYVFNTTGRKCAIRYSQHILSLLCLSFTTSLFLRRLMIQNVRNGIIFH